MHIQAAPQDWLCMHIWLCVVMDLGWRLSLQSISNLPSAYCTLHHPWYNSHNPLEWAVPGSDCCGQPASMQVSPIFLLFTWSSLCNCYSQLQKPISLKTLALLLQLKPGRSKPLKMHQWNMHPERCQLALPPLPTGLELQQPGRKTSRERTHLPD